MSRIGGGHGVTPTEQLDCGLLESQELKLPMQPEELHVKSVKTGRWKFVRK